MAALPFSRLAPFHPACVPSPAGLLPPAPPDGADESRVLRLERMRHHLRGVETALYCLAGARGRLAVIQSQAGTITDARSDLIAVADELGLLRLGLQAEVRSLERGGGL